MNRGGVAVTATLTELDSSVAGEIVEEGLSSKPALGRDPFTELSEPDPFIERLNKLQQSSPAVRRESQRTILRSAHEPTPRAGTSGRTSTKPEHSTGPQRPIRLPLRSWATTPTLGEIELDDLKELIDHLLSDHERRVLAGLAQLVEGEAPYDRYGFSPHVLKRAFPIFHTLYRLYFRVKSEGHEHIPTEGPAILAGNHGGLLPFDGAMGIVDIALNTDPPRLARAIVDRWAGSLPWVNIFYARVGQVIGTRKNFADLLGDGQLVMVFPEGIDGIRKTVAQRYRLQNFRVGFIEQALREQAPIVPMAYVGTDDQTPILYDIKPLAKRLGLPVLPITPTFPLLGPLGLLPYPVAYKIVYGEPLRFHERFGPEGADDPRLVRYLANQVRRSVQLLVDRNRK